jgi:hypothetical protein
MARVDSPEIAGELRRRLRADSPAEAACATALDAGAELWAWDDTVPAAHLLTIYRRRIERLNRENAQTLGSAAFLSELEHAASAGVSLSPRLVRGDTLNFFVALDATSARQACLGIDASLGNPDFDWDAAAD